MFLREFNGWPQENSHTQQLKCPNCGNTTDHYVYVAPYGFQVGTIFSNKPLLGAKKYFLACPTCDNLTKELSKEQALAMRKSP
jgi:hypothetical protein